MHALTWATVSSHKEEEKMDSTIAAWCWHRRAKKLRSLVLGLALLTASSAAQAILIQLDFEVGGYQVQAI